MIIYEALDFTVGLFDRDGQTLSIGLGLPMFIRGMSDVVKAKIAHWGHADIHPGDILLTNDAYTTGAHLNHLTFSIPVFHKGRIVAFATCRDDRYTSHQLSLDAVSIAEPQAAIRYLITQ